MLELCIVNNYDISALFNSKTLPHIENLICLSSQITSINSVKPIGLLVDYPYGQANSQVREHEIMYGVRNNVKFIDVSISIKKLKEQSIKEILSEIKTFKQIVGDKAQIRPIIEFSDIDTSMIVDISTSLYNHGYCSYITLGTGVYNTDFNDVLINASLVQEKSNLKVIAAVQNITQSMLDSLKKNHIFGVRVMSQKSLERIFK